MSSVTHAGEKKGRGRPRKAPGCEGGSTVGARLDPTNDGYMKSEDRAGGPTDPMCGFEDCIRAIFESDQKKRHYAVNCITYPLYEYLSRYSHRITPMGGASDEPVSEHGTKSAKDVKNEISSLAETKRNMMNCEQIFTLYLREFSQMLNSSFYSQKLLKFIIFFRDCLNIYGWQKRAENEMKDFVGKPDFDDKVKDRLETYEPIKQSSEFTAMNNAEFAPEIANEFVTIYYDTTIAGHLSRNDVIDLT